MKKEATLIFPHQLFEDHPALDKKRTIYLVEHPRFFTDFLFHQQKLVLHRASMKYYQHFLEKKGYEVIYHEYYVPFKKIFTHIKKAHIVEVVDRPLEEELKNTFSQLNIEIIWHATPTFLSSTQWLQETLSNKKHYLMNTFYITQRKKLNILVKDGKPVGGKWSYDSKNRLKLPGSINLPAVWHPSSNAFVVEGQKYVQKNFKNNPGSGTNFIWPITHLDAKKALDDFLKNRLALFGLYQDAIDSDKNFLFHSLLSSSLNNGLLTPAFVIGQTLAHAKKHTIPLNSLEGFIRQIIGWREFVYGIYLLKGKEQRCSNFFNHQRQLPDTFWSATTSLAPIDDTIKKLLASGYAHHIERLMVLGNFMFLTETHPDDVYKWFMELFIDAYDWVMVPNVYGMSQYADGGLMTTKPYFSSSNYIRKMSNYKKANWCAIWDALFWRFMYKNKKTMKLNPRMALLASYFSKIKATQLQEHLRIAENYLHRQNK